VEVDVEGLDRTDDHLWIVGSHSRGRKQVDDADDADEARGNLTRVRPTSSGWARWTDRRGGARGGATGDGRTRGLATDDHPGVTLP
jgi:hypothetical protein